MKKKTRKAREWWVVMCEHSRDWPDFCLLTYSSKRAAIDCNGDKSLVFKVREVLRGKR